MGAVDRGFTGADLQRAGSGGAPARPGRLRAPGCEQHGARGRGRGPAVEDRPGAPAAARLAAAGHRPRAARGRRSGRPGQGRSQQRRLRPGTSGAPHRRQPGRRTGLLTAAASKKTQRTAKTQLRPLAGSGAECQLAGLRELGVALCYRRLAVRGLVLVDDALARRLVQLAAGGAQRGARLVEVPLVRRLAEFTDGRPQRRFGGLVPLVRLFVLLITLDLRLYVRHAWESFRLSVG